MEGSEEVMASEVEGASEVGRGRVASGQRGSGAASVVLVVEMPGE